MQKFLFFCFVLTLLTGCRSYSEVYLNCEEAAVGTVCFENNTDRTIDLRIGNNRADVLPFSQACFEMNEGTYDYKGKRGLRRWRGDVFVPRCEVSGVGMFD